MPLPPRPEIQPAEAFPGTTDESGWLERSIYAALNQRILIVAISLLLAAVGLWSFITLHVDAVPDISNIQVTVTTNARGLAPGEVEQYVTYPVELALQSMPRLSLLRSISKYSLSQVTAVFDDGTDIYWARQQVSERLKTATEQMPPNADIKTALGPIATGLGEIYQFQVKGPGYSLLQLRDILDWQIAPALKMVRGVDEVQAMGGEAKEYQVWLDPEKMHGYCIHASDVFAALAHNNANASGGYTQEYSDQILIRGEGMLRTTADISRVTIRRNASGIVRIRDVGAAVVGKKLPQSVVTCNGKGEAVIGIVVMRKGENSKEVVERIKLAVARLASSLPQNVTIEPFYDRGVLIDRTIDTVWHNLLYGAFFVLVVLFALLGSVRGAIIAALSIPLALAGALLFLNASGTSGNLLSLGAIDFGILIDGSVFMVENIVRRLADHRTAGREKLAVVRDAAAEVATPVLFAVLIITAVYLPILMLPGVSGKTFRPMALTMVFGLVTALWIALYLTPVLSHFLLEARPAERETWLMRFLRKPYRHLLLSCVGHPIATITAAVSVFVISLLALPGIGTEFVPVLKEGSTVLTINRPVSGSLKQAAKQTTLIEQILRGIPEVKTIVSRTGHSEIAFDPMGPDETDTFVILKDPKQWTAGMTQQNIENRITRSLNAALPGLIFSLSQPIEQRMNELIAGAKGDIAIRIYGKDLDKLCQLSTDVANVLARIHGSSGIKVEQTAGLPIVTARLNQGALAAYGVAAQDALDVVTAAVDGKVVGTIFEGKPRHDLCVRFEPEAVKRAEDIGSLPVAMSAGDVVPLGQLSKIEKQEGPALITHRQDDRVITVQVNVRDRDLGGFADKSQQAVAAAVTLPAGYRIEWGGQFENMREAQAKLMLLVPLSLLFIFLLLQGLYNDVKPALLIFTNIPLAISGGLFGLLIRGMHLSVTAGVGFIALFGVAVLNGVVLVSTIRKLEHDQQLKPRTAAIIGATSRLRPVLMTALVAALGFVPMAVATSVGAEVQRPLATVVIAGLVTSTILTLLVLPSIYPLICSRPKRRQIGS